MAKKRTKATPKKVEPNEEPQETEVETDVDAILESIDAIDEPAADEPDDLDASDETETDEPSLSDLQPAELRNLLSSARTRKQREKEAEILDALAQIPDHVTVRIPISELQKDGYGCSVKMPPTDVKKIRLKHPQGLHLAKVQLGMLDSGETLNDGTVVTSKEKTMNRILELIGNAISEQVKD